VGDGESRERHDVGAAFQERDEVGDRLGFAADAVAEVGQAVGPEVEEVGPVVGGGDADGVQPDEFAGVAAGLLGRAYEVADQLEVGTADDRLQRDRADVAGPAVHHPIRHGLTVTPTVKRQAAVG